MLIELKGGEFAETLNRLKFSLRVLVYDKKVRRYKASIYEFDALYEFCDKYRIEFHVTEKLYRYYKKFVRRINRLVDAKKNKEFNLDLWTDNKECKLLPYQCKAANAAVLSRRFLIGDEMGVGKTPESIAVMLKAFQDYDKSTALIVCPTRVQHQWKQEIEKFTKLDMTSIEVFDEMKCVTNATDKFRANRVICKACKNFKQCKKNKDSVKYRRRMQIKGSKILIVGYEGMKANVDFMINKQYGVVIFDEATKIKNYNTQNTRAARRLVQALPFDSFVLALSGTFIENRLEELYVISDIIDDRLYGPYCNFKNTYLSLDFWGHVIGYRNQKEFKNRLKNIIIRRTVDKVWKDRPPIVVMTRECPMGKGQEKIYAQTREGVLQDIKDAEKAKQINNAMLATLMGYLLQVADTVKAIDPEYNGKDHSSKISILSEILSEEVPRKDKVVIFSRFAYKVIPHIVEAIGKLKLGNVGCIVGKNKAQAPGIIKSFCNDPKMRFLVCSDTLAYGANLQMAQHIVNFDLPWNPAIVDQRVARVYRRGQKRTVNEINLIVPDTIEEHLYRMLNQKRQVAAEFLKQSSVTQKLSFDLKKLARLI